MKKKKTDSIHMIKGQTEQLSRDVYNATLLGMSYGKYMGMKHDELAIALKRIKKEA